VVTFSELPAVVVAAKQTPNSSIDQGGGKRRVTRGCRRLPPADFGEKIRLSHFLSGRS